MSAVSNVYVAIKDRKRSLSAFAVVTIAIIAVYTIYDLNGKSLDPRDRELLLIVTDSMNGSERGYAIGSFSAGTAIMVKHLSGEDLYSLREGDVISFRQGSILNHHRITSIDYEGGYVVTKGDNAYSHEVVEFEDINGKVVGTNRPLGWLISTVKEYGVWIIVPLIAVTSIELLQWAFSRDKEKEE